MTGATAYVEALSDEDEKPVDLRYTEGRITNE